MEVFFVLCFSLEVAHAVSYSSLGQNLSSDEAGRAASFCRLEEWERTLLNLWQDTEDITAASSLLLKWLCEIPLRHHRDGELSDPENSPSKQKTLGPSLDELTMLLFLFFSLIPSPPTTQGDKSNRASEKDTLNVLEREKLESAFMRAFLLQKVNKEGLLTAFVPGSSSEVEFDLVCQKLFDMLNELSSHRVHLNDLSSNSEKWKLSIVPTASEECFLVSLVKLLVDSSRPEIAELERHAEEGFRDLIKSKFSLFVNVAKEKPGDAETVIIFVSEGLTPYEIVAVRELLAKSNAQETSRKNIILGGTNLLTVERTVRNLLNQCLG
ncbi:unnamed protein product [Cyprideis torosa]|uniref:Uncharacterized protein n=1 Tax=Cyprideis torosa TaxID=163714 RepID=A0A7R8WB49_9CRUS|nr:unnamed protein product [Cyprideis torosa]CAG0891733.1 unnamed protein product [Cyprideis torosa]